MKATPFLKNSVFQLGQKLGVVKIFCKMKVSTHCFVHYILKILFVTILKLTEFFEALTKSYEYLIDKSDVINFDGELDEICGLKKKLNATLVNMGRSE